MKSVVVDSGRAGRPGASGGPGDRPGGSPVPGAVGGSAAGCGAGGSHRRGGRRQEIVTTNGQLAEVDGRVRVIGA